MAGLAETIERLRKGTLPAMGMTPGVPSRLRPLADFGSNPGALVGHCLPPPAGAAPAPLVVVLHGCTQNAAAYDHGSGWSTLAERHGFALLFPEQQRSNNPNNCFNWFQPEDSARERGEALSIRQMIEAMCDAYPIDRRRIFVTGLSAGGAMASVMLAAYPEVFAGGAIIAGLAFGIAGTVPEALERMRGQGLPRPAELGRRLRAASSHRGAWPTVSVWHGTGDRTVVPANASAIVDQWRSVHGAAAEPDRSDTVDGHVRRVWQDRNGRDAIEEYRINGLGHGTPLRTGGPDGCGVAGPHMLEAGISSTVLIARGWGLVPARAASGEATATPLPAPKARAFQREAEPAPAAAHGVGEVIEHALRAAGLMR